MTKVRPAHRALTAGRGFQDRKVRKVPREKQVLRVRKALKGIKAFQDPRALKVRRETKGLLDRKDKPLRAKQARPGRKAPKE